MTLFDGATSVMATVEGGQWLPVRYLVDLDNDTYEVCYNDTSLYKGVFLPNYQVRLARSRKWSSYPV